MARGESSEERKARIARWYAEQEAKAYKRLVDKQIAKLEKLGIAVVIEPAQPPPRPVVVAKQPPPPKSVQTLLAPADPVEEKPKPEKEDRLPNLNKLFQERFDVFWKAYPRKVAKGKALKVWGKIRPSDLLLGKIIAALEIQKRSEQWVKDKGQYIPHPSTWLGQRRWEDGDAPQVKQEGGAPVVESAPEPDKTQATLARRKEMLQRLKDARAGKQGEIFQ